jgi:hypothetical protein
MVGEADLGVASRFLEANLPRLDQPQSPRRPTKLEARRDR